VTRSAPVLALAWLSAVAHAQPISCAEPQRPVVILQAHDVAIEAMAQQLAVGLGAAGVAVCGVDQALGRRVASVELAPDPQRLGAVLIRVSDDVTRKTLQRSIELAAIPRDSRATALALYVEELLQASWAELALNGRQYLREHPAAAPPEVQREVDSVLSAPVRSPRIVNAAAQPRENAAAQPRERAWRISLGALLLSFPGMLTEYGPNLTVGYRVLPWLEPALRVGYRVSSTLHAPHGTIASEAVLAGAYVDAFFALSRVFSLHFPQGFDVSRITFLPAAHADSTSVASATRTALVVQHGAGLRTHITDALSISAIGSFCWTLLSARAADDQIVVAGIAGVGAAAELTLDGHM
jgi:hypothetical protein